MFSLMLRLILVGFFVLLPTTAHLQIKIMSYNLLNYPSNSEERNPHFRTIIEAIDPDILVVQEMNAGGTETFLDSVLNYAAESYHAGEFIDGPNTDNALFYRDSLFTFIRNLPITTQLRDINEFTLIFEATNDTIRLYSLHLKASRGGENEERRAAEVDSLRRVTDSLSAGSNFIVCGDFNIYNSEEDAYQRLLSVEEDADGHVLDPIDLPGNWHNNEDFTLIHTQSTRSRQFGGGAPGGLDDRFDMILVSQAANDSGGFTYINNSYVTYGNDGFHFNDSINARPNRAVSNEIVDALHFASDHLPVYALFDVKAEFIEDGGKWKPMSFALYQNYPNPFNSSTTITYNLSFATNVSIQLYNLSGHMVVKLADGLKMPGIHTATLIADRLTTGLYFVRMQASDQVFVRKTMLIK